jgi:nicotinamidase-related amidase
MHHAFPANSESWLSFMSVSSTDKGLLTPDNCAVIFIDHQPQMFFGVASMDRQELLNNALVLAKAAKIFDVPVILTGVESKGFSGNITPQLLDVFCDQIPIERSSMKGSVLGSWYSFILFAVQPGEQSPIRQSANPSNRTFAQLLKVLFA